MQRVDELLAPPVVGETYLVDCVLVSEKLSPRTLEGALDRYEKSRSERDKNFLWEYSPLMGTDKDLILVPILAPAHDDLEIGIKDFHFHTNLRLFSRELFNRTNCWNQAIFQTVCNIQKNVPMVCLNTDRFGINAFFLWKFYKDKKMTNLRCPHKGAWLGSIETIEGCRRCPMHGLKWNMETGEGVQ